METHTFLNRGGKGDFQPYGRPLTGEEDGMLYGNHIRPQSQAGTADNPLKERTLYVVAVRSIIWTKGHVNGIIRKSLNQ